MQLSISATCASGKKTQSHNKAAYYTEDCPGCMVGCADPKDAGRANNQGNKSERGADQVDKANETI